MEKEPVNIMVYVEVLKTVCVVRAMRKQKGEIMDKEKDWELSRGERVIEEETLLDVVNDIKELVCNLSQKDFLKAMEEWFGMETNIVLYEVFLKELEAVSAYGKEVDITSFCNYLLDVKEEK